jgi:hypothetical protein
VLTDEAPLIGRALQAVARIVRHEVRAAAAAVEGQHERRRVRGRDQAAEYDVVAALHRQPLFR